MEAKIFEMATQQGLTAVLFVVLLWHTLKTSNERELRLQRVIDNNQVVIDNNQKIMADMVSRLDKLDSIEDAVDEIKTTLTVATTTAATRLP